MTGTEIYSRENIETICLVQEFFKDYDKTKAWLHLDNPHLGCVSPVSLMLRGRSEKLLKWVKTSLAENEA